MDLRQTPFATRSCATTTMDDTLRPLSTFPIRNAKCLSMAKPTKRLRPRPLRTPSDLTSIFRPRSNTTTTTEQGQDEDMTTTRARYSRQVQQIDLHIRRASDRESASPTRLDETCSNVVYLVASREESDVWGLAQNVPPPPPPPPSGPKVEHDSNAEQGSKQAKVHEETCSSEKRREQEDKEQDGNVEMTKLNLTTLDPVLFLGHKKRSRSFSSPIRTTPSQTTKCQRCLVMNGLIRVPCAWCSNLRSPRALWEV